MWGLFPSSLRKALYQLVLKWICLHLPFQLWYQLHDPALTICSHIPWWSKLTQSHYSKNTALNKTTITVKPRNKRNTASSQTLEKNKPLLYSTSKPQRRPNHSTCKGPTTLHARAQPLYMQGPNFTWLWFGFTQMFSSLLTTYTQRWGRDCTEIPNNFHELLPYVYIPQSLILTFYLLQEYQALSKIFLRMLIFLLY